MFDSGVAVWCGVVMVVLYGVLDLLGTFEIARIGGMLEIQGACLFNGLRS